jgi:integrase
MLTEHLARRGLGAEDANALIFVSPGGGPLRASNFRNRVWGPATQAAGLDGLTFHGLRHVATSLMVEAGLHPRVIQHRLGQSTARLSMELYAHVSDDADRDAAQHLDARFKDGRGTPGARSDQIRSK